MKHLIICAITTQFLNLGNLIKKSIFIFALISLASATKVCAQVEEKVVELTDLDWSKYAKVEIMTAEFLAKKSEELKTLIKGNAAFGTGARYNTIKAAWGNASKEAGIKMTEEERAAFAKVMEAQDSLQQMVITYQAGLIQDEKFLGIDLYQQISEELKNNPAMRVKLDQEVEKLKKKKP